MATTILAIALLCFASALAQTDPQNTMIGCDPNNQAQEDYTVTYYTRTYTGTNHVAHWIKLTFNRPAESHSLTVCFDSPQCLTAVFSYHTYANTAPNDGNFTGMFCVDVVPSKHQTQKMEVGDMVLYEIHTYSPSSSGQVSMLFLNTNGVREGQRVAEVPASDPNDFCSFCEGGYIVDLNDCRKFYQCYNGVAYAFECSIIGYFDMSLKTCNYKWDAGCFSDGAMGLRRFQCKDSDGNCPTLADVGNPNGPSSAEMLPHTQAFMIKGCTHSNTPQTAPAQPSPAP